MSAILAMGSESSEFNYIIRDRLLNPLVEIGAFCYYQGFWLKTFLQGAHQLIKIMGAALIPY